MSRKLRIVLLTLFFIFFASICPVLLQKAILEQSSKKILISADSNIINRSSMFSDALNEDIKAIYFPEYEISDYETTFFNESLIADAYNNGYEIILLIAPTNKPQAFYANFESIISKYSVKHIIFYSDRNFSNQDLNISNDLITLIRNNNLIIGVAEDEAQRTIMYKDVLLEVLGTNNIMASRVLYIKNKDILDLSSKELTFRLLRSIVDRGIRGIILSAEITSTDNNKLIDSITKLSSELSKHGYTTENELTSIPKYTQSKFLDTATLICFAISLILLASCFSKYRRTSFFIATFLLCALMISMRYAPIYLFRQLIALGISITIPSLSVILITHTFKYQCSALVSGIFNVFFIFICNIIGGLLIAACQFDYGFILSLYPFDFAAITYIFPLVIVVFWQLHLASSSKIKRHKDFNFLQYFLPINLSKLISLSIIILAFYIYISRSGNASLFPATKLELDFRMFLESIFGARPRTKEFLIGYPCLFLLPLALNSKNAIIKQLVTIGATITGISICNSFCHGFTPFTVSLQRSIGGLILGIIFGILSFEIRKRLCRIRLRMHFMSVSE